MKKLFEPRVKILDKDHQEFNGKIYSRVHHRSQKYFRNGDTWLHRDVWKYFHGEISSKISVHHIDHDTDNNNIENLQIMTNVEHVNLHIQERTTEKICLGCGKTFISKGSDYCSPSCWAKFYRSGNSPTVDYITKICPHCGKEFKLANQSQAKDAHYCSRNCAMIARHLSKRIAMAEKYKTCKQCGKPLSAEQISHDCFCSESCFRKYKFRHDREERTCVICGKTFSAYKRSPTKTCSLKCGIEFKRSKLPPRPVKICPYCGKEILPSDPHYKTKTFCSMTCYNKARAIKSSP